MLFLLFVFALHPRLDESIVVTAERIEQPWRETTAAVTLLDESEISKLPASDLGDALRIVPGLQLISVNPGMPPIIASRGFFGAGEVEYLRLLVDGTPVGDTESGLADWRSVPVESIEHIEVLRGAGSSLFGDAAMGGVVQVFRRRGTFASISSGSFETRRWAGGWSGDVLSVSASGTNADGFRENGASEEIFGNIGLRRGAWRLSLDGSQRRREDPGALTAEQLENDRFASDAIFDEDEERTNSVRFSAQYRGAIDALIHVRHRNGDRTRTLLLAPGFGDRATRDVETFGAGANAMRTVELSDGSVVGGVELGHDALRSRYESIDGSGRRRNAAAFVSGEWRITESLRLAGGARWDSIADAFEGTDVRDKALSPRAGIAFETALATTYVQVSRAFKAPTLDQRFDQRPLPDFTGGTFTISNPALRAQHSKNVEVGARSATASYAWELVGYQADVDDEIDFDVRTFRYANIGRSRHRGIESMARWMPSDRHGLGLTYTWTRATSEGKQLKNIAEHVIRADAEHRGFVDVHFAVEHSADRFLDDDNLFPLDDATVVDMRIAKSFASVTAALDAKNLFDEQYSPLGFALGDVPFYFPAASRSIALTLSWSRP